MTVTVRDVCQAMESWAPPGYAYAWDKVGLSIGEPGARVRGVLVCLTVNRAAFDAARKAKANMVVAHHPLIWEPLAALRTDDVHTRLCLDFAEAKIACFAAHTNLDLAPGGVNHVLANALGLVDLAPLLPANHAGQIKLVTFVPESHLARLRDAVSQAGAGVIGDYTHCTFSTPGVGTFLPGDAARPYSGAKGRVNEEAERRFETLVPKARLAGVLDALQAAHPYDEVAYDLVPLENPEPGIGLGLRGQLPKPCSLRRFADQVRGSLKLGPVRVVGPLNKRIKHVAVLGGAGGGEAGSVPDGVDVLVTGDVKYHDACAALDRGLAIIDAGHAGTEKPIVPVMARFLRKRFKGLRVGTYVEREIFETL